MKASSETYADQDERELDLQIGRILLKINRKWQEAGEREHSLAKTAEPSNEMDTLIIFAGSEAAPPVPPVADELTETVILSPLAHEARIGTAAVSIEEAVETVIITSGTLREMPSADDASAVENETVVLEGDGAYSGQTTLREEERLDETIVLPPRKEQLKRRGIRQR